MPKLLISLPTGDISRELSGDIISIGRTRDNSVQIDHHSVSAHHAKLTLVNGNYRVKDLESTNRTFVNGTPVNEAELTVSCILRIGSVECVYKVEKAESSSGDAQSQLGELQRQLENLMKARDLISQQNRSLVKERDEARQEAEIAQVELNDAKRQLEQFQSGRVPAAAGNAGDAGKLAEAKKQIELMSREREALLISNQELKTQVMSLTAKATELQQKATQAAVQLQVAASVQQHAAAAAASATSAQEKAAARVKQDMDESVEEEFEEEAQLAGAGQKTAAGAGAGGGARILSGAPLISSWLNRGAKRKADQGTESTRITPMTPPAPPAPAAPVAPTEKAASPATGAPTLRLVQPPPVPDPQALTASSPAVKIGRASANLAPQNPDIKPVWELLNRMRRSLHYFLRHQDELQVLEEMAASAHELTEMSQADVLRPIHELAGALEALISDLHSSPVNINPSTLRTVGQCIDFIATLIHESNLGQIRDVTTARILAIDDDEGILETIKATMEMVHVNIETASQSNAGLMMLSEQNFDMILLDVGMPEMNGMDICSRVRAMPHHQKTPIVFLTGEATVQNRVQSTLNGGNDMIGKPFSILELAVKVIVWIFKGQLGMV
ncbi:MAG TPA: response regulator [Chthoniobacteraceae bacterium]|nr:response regulator [Chthoniobacteraceae bacterium]